MTTLDNTYPKEVTDFHTALRKFCDLYKTEQGFNYAAIGKHLTIEAGLAEDWHLNHKSPQPALAPVLTQEIYALHAKLTQIVFTGRNSPGVLFMETL